MAPVTRLWLWSLPDDALALVAKRVLYNGEAYWFACTCCAMRDAIQAACKELKVEQCTTNVRTVFASLPRLRASMRLNKIATLVLANRNARGVEGLPTSLDGLYTWTPSTAKAIVAGATCDVLNYVWPQWAYSISTKAGPACALASACCYGRVDLLDVMCSITPSTNWDTKCLQRVVRLAVEGHPPSKQCLIHGAFHPIVHSANYQSAEWLYYKMEDMGESVGDHAWRSWLLNQFTVREITECACRSQEPRESLRMLTDWMLPRFASRTLSHRTVAMQEVLYGVLYSVTSDSHFMRPETRCYAWQWMVEKWPLGLAHLLRHLRECSLECRTPMLNIANVHRNCFRVMDVDTYKWMREELEPCNGWMYHAVMFTEGYIEWTTSKELETMRKREACCSAEWRFAMHVHHRIIRQLDAAQSSFERRRLWGMHRVLLVETFADCMLYFPDDEHFQAHCSSWQPCFGCLSACAFSESVNNFHERATPRQRDLVARTLIHRVARYWENARAEIERTNVIELNEFGERPPFFDSDEEDSSAFEHISSLRCEHNWKDLFNDRG
tara:strand:+ start:8 stop:1672 length:1665 start_codon:yes stop_codon:yes gene_type:complete